MSGLMSLGETFPNLPFVLGSIAGGLLVAGVILLFSGWVE